MRYEAGRASSNLTRLQEHFGERPGDYLVDPYWFRRNRFTGKPDLWDTKTKSWKQIRLMDEFDWDDEGNVVKV